MLLLERQTFKKEREFQGLLISLSLSESFKIFLHFFFPKFFSRLSTDSDLRGKEFEEREMTKKGKHRDVRSDRINLAE